MMTEEKKKQIADALSKRIGIIVCPMCHQSKYTLIDGFIGEQIQDDYKKIYSSTRIFI